MRISTGCWAPTLAALPLRCPPRGSNSRLGTARRRSCPLRLRKRHALLPLIFAPSILVRRLTDFIGFEEDHLRDTFVGVDFRGKRRRVRKLQRHVAFPFRFEGRDVDDDAAIADEDPGFEGKVSGLRYRKTVHVVIPRLLPHGDNFMVARESAAPELRNGLWKTAEY